MATLARPELLTGSRKFGRPMKFIDLVHLQSNHQARASRSQKPFTPGGVGTVAARQHSCLPRDSGSASGAAAHRPPHPPPLDHPPPPSRSPSAAEHCQARPAPPLLAARPSAFATAGDVQVRTASSRLNVRRLGLRAWSQAPNARNSATEMRQPAHGQQHAHRGCGGGELEQRGAIQ